MKVLEPSRTICEKIMRLVRFSYTESPIQNLKNKIRHTYNIYQLLQQTGFKGFVESEGFIEMLIKVANDDGISFRNNNVWLTNHPNESLFFKEIEELWKSELMEVYTVDFKNLVYGELPKENEVIENLKYLRDRMTKIKSDIKAK
jgi:hypothetical protein